MAFRKTAQATMVHPATTLQAWTRQARVASVLRKAKVAPNLLEKASTIFETPFDPKRYLLSHATIVCSVDTYAPPNVKTGSDIVDRFKVNRKYADFRITPRTAKYINHNFDAWSRAVLLKSFRTFIGAQNFLEHVQKLDLSKGRILDAVARDVGESIYVDILVATDLKHKELVKDIRSGKLSTLSMGCEVHSTVCTKCGHVAYDDTDLCPHILYEKGNTFYDENMQRHLIAELCGHVDIEDHPTAGVDFIEASWVGTPAFTGAVLRNILDFGNLPAEVSRRASEILSTPPKEWVGANRKRVAFMEDEGEGEEDGEEGGPDEQESPAPQAEQDDLKGVEDALVKDLMDRVKRRVQKDMGKDDPQLGPSMQNDNLAKQAYRSLYVAGLRRLVKIATSEADLINRVAQYNIAQGVDIPVSVYRAALEIGPVKKGSVSLNQWNKLARRTAACQDSLPNAKALYGLGRILQSWRAVNLRPLGDKS